MPKIIDKSKNHIEAHVDKKGHVAKKWVKNASLHTEQVKQIKEATGNQWLTHFKQFNLSKYPPPNIKKEEVEINYNGNFSKEWVLRWRDKSGKRQDAYTKEFMQKNAEKKWQRVGQMLRGKVDLETIQQKLRNGLRSEDTKISESSAAILLMLHTGLRPGDRTNFKKTENRGITTLSPDNIVFDPDQTVVLNFTGKSYKENVGVVHDSSLYNYLTSKVNKEKPFVFDVDRSTVEDVYRKVYGMEQYKLKDLRTLKASQTAQFLINNGKTELISSLTGNFKQDSRVIKAYFNDVDVKVSKVLNNTPAMARTSYIHPNIKSAFLKELGYNPDDFFKAIEGYYLEDVFIDYPASTTDVDIVEDDETESDMLYPTMDWEDDDFFKTVETDLEKAKRKELVWVANPKVAGGGYHRFQEVGSEKNIYSSKHFFLHQVFPVGKQGKYEKYLTDLVDMGDGNYATIAKKVGARGWEGARAGKSKTGVTKLPDGLVEEYDGLHVVKLHPEEVHFRNTLLAEHGDEQFITNYLDARRNEVERHKGIDSLYQNSAPLDPDLADFCHVAGMLDKYTGDNLDEMHMQFKTVRGENLIKEKQQRQQIQQQRQEDEHTIRQYREFEENKRKFADNLGGLTLTGKKVGEIYKQLFFGVSPSPWFVSNGSKIPVKIDINGIEHTGTYQQILDFFKRKMSDPRTENTGVSFDHVTAQEQDIPNPYSEAYLAAINRMVINKSVEDDLEKRLDSKPFGLIKKVKLIHRHGKTFLATYWINPRTGEISSNVKTDELKHEYKHDELAVGDSIIYSDPKTGERYPVPIKRFEHTKKYPHGAIILDMGAGKEKSISLASAAPVTKADSVDAKPFKKSTPTPEPIKPTGLDISMYKYVDSIDMVKTTSEIKLGGSGENFAYATKDGESVLAIKLARLKDGSRITGQIHCEVLADEIYRKLGYEAPNSVVGKFDGKVAKICEFIEGARQLGKLSGSEYEKARKEIQKGFLLDCLLGNWDVIGAVQDNILVKDGKVIRCDNGGSLFYRAQGARKRPDDFASTVKELDTFLDGTNPVVKKIFGGDGGVDPDEIQRQLKHIIAKKDEILKSVDSSSLDVTDRTNLRTILNQRISYLETKLGEVKVPPKPKYDYDKTLYSSKATADFFKTWEKDTANIEGNPEIKDTIKKRILKMEKQHQDVYERYAKEHGIDVEEYKQRLQNKIQKLMSKADFFRATDAAYLEHILLKDGRFKSQFETRTSGGCLSPTTRADTEHKYFGFVNDIHTNKENRPIYGYTSDDPNGIHNDDGTSPPPNDVSQYGHVTIKMKRDVALRKATVTFGDSLSSASVQNATFVAKPHFTSWNMYGDPLKAGDRLAKYDLGGSYAEVQYHNKFTVEDIESIHFSSNNYRSKTEALEDMNHMIDVARKTSIPIKIY